MSFFKLNEQGYLSKKDIRAVEAPLAEAGWTKSTSWGGAVCLEREGIKLDFMIKRSHGSYYEYAQSEEERESRPRQVTIVSMHFRGHDYKDVIKKISYKKFTLEWVESTFALMKELQQKHFEIKDHKETKDAHQSKLARQAQDLATEIGLGIFDVEGYKRADIGKDRYVLRISDLTEADVRELANHAKNLKAMRSEVDTAHEDDTMEQD